MTTNPRVTPTGIDDTIDVDALPQPVRDQSHTVTRGYVVRIDDGPWFYLPRRDLADQLAASLTLAVGCEQTEIRAAAVQTNLMRGGRLLLVGPTVHLQHTAPGELSARYFGKV